MNEVKNRDFPKTAAELIAELQKYPGNMRVMTSGYEGGYQDCGEPAVISVKLNKNTEWYYGPHDTPEDNESADIDAILI